MKRNSLTLTIGVVLVIIFFLLLFTFQVRVAEVAIVTTFGKPTRTITEPGLKFKLPWPIQKDYKLDSRVQTFFEDKFTQDYTGEGYALISMVYVGWRITDANSFFSKFPGGEIASAEQALGNLVRSEKSAAVGRHPLADFVNTNEKQLKFDQIENDIKARIQSKLDANNYGMKIEFLGVKKLGVPESVTQQVFERMTAERKRLVSVTESEAEKDSSRIRSDADASAGKILADARGQAQLIRSQGESIAAKSLPTFQKNPDLAVFLLSLDSLEQSLKDRSILIIDQRTPPFSILNGLPAATQPAKNK